MELNTLISVFYKDMGAIYKLKKEIVDFIVDSKKKDPSVSCRRLVDVARDSFSITLSKSSINSVLKKNSLSSPVGRRASAQSKASKFKIPAEKKRQLFLSKDSADPKNIFQELSQRKEEGDLSLERPEEKVAQKLSGRRKTDRKDIGDNVDEKILKKKKEIKTEKAVSAQPTKNIKDGILYDGMGSIFLKAAEWELSERSLFGSLLEAQMKDNDNFDIDAVADILLYLEIFGIKGVKKISEYEGQGLWALNGVEKRGVEDNICSVLDKPLNMSNLEMKYSVEMPQVFTELTCFNIFLEDGSKIIIDAQMTSLLQEGKQAEMAVPLHKGMKTIVNELLNNVQSAILCSADSSGILSEDFYNMFLSFENCEGKRIAKITGNDSQGQEIACFSSIPLKKRTFIAGLWPWQEGFEILLKHVDISGKEDKEARTKLQNVLYREISANLLSDRTPAGIEPLRVFLLTKPDANEPICGVVTNASQNKDPQDIIEAYLNRWPNLQNSYNLAQIQQDDINSSNFEQKVLKKSSFWTKFDDNFGIYEFNSLGEIVKETLTNLNDYCIRHYFPLGLKDIDVSSAISMFYSIPGQIEAGSDYLRVLLAPSGNEGNEYINELKTAIMRINERAIIDHFGRRLLLEIDK